MIISIDSEKAKHSFLMKAPNKLKIEGNVTNPTKNTYEKLTTNIMPNSKKKKLYVTYQTVNMLDFACHIHILLHICVSFCFAFLNHIYNILYMFKYIIYNNI